MPLVPLEKIMLRTAKSNNSVPVFQVYLSADRLMVVSKHFKQNVYWYKQCTIKRNLPHPNKPMAGLNAYVFFEVFLRGCSFWSKIQRLICHVQK